MQKAALVAMLLPASMLVAQDTGWQILFDGKTPSGWLEVTGRPFPAQSWTIEDGCLKAFPNADGNQDIRTAATFRSFELRFEWKIAQAGNSGVKYLVQATDRWQRKGQKGFNARARGLEYQLTDDVANSDAQSGLSRTSAALYGILAPAKTDPARAGMFHQSRIVVDGGRVQHWLDGVKTVDFSLTDEKVAAALRALSTRNGKDPSAQVHHESFISLQNHNSEVWFRDIKVRRLD